MEFGLAPETMPMGRPTARVRNMAAKVSSRVSGQVSPMSFDTGAISPQGAAQVPVGHLPYIFHVAGEDRPVKAELMPQLGHRFLGCVFAQHEFGRIARIISRMSMTRNIMARRTAMEAASLFNT